MNAVLSAAPTCAAVTLCGLDVSPVCVLNNDDSTLVSKDDCKLTTSLIGWVCADEPNSERFILPLV